MWRLKIADGGSDPYIYSTNNFVGRQTWEFDPQAGSPQERAEVEELVGISTTTGIRSNLVVISLANAGTLIISLSFPSTAIEYTVVQLGSSFRLAKLLKKEYKLSRVV
ncbi:hypothetical protein SLA2020_418060 [Shorea laevis]